MENPFVFGKVVKGEHFADRVTEIRELKKTLRAGQNIILYGPRRYGKTSLAEVAMEELKKEGFVVAKINVELITSKKSLAELWAGAIHTAFYPVKKRFFETISMLKEHFPSIKLKPFEDLPMSIEFDEPRINETRMLQKALALPQLYAERKKKNVIFVVDEFPFLVKNIGGEILHLIRGIVQEHSEVAYLFLGSSRSMMQYIFDEKESPFYKFGKKMDLKTLPINEFATFIKEKFTRANIKIEDEKILKILEISSSHPYYTQQLCHEIWNIAFETKNVSDESIESAIAAIIENERSVYSQILEGLTSTQLRVLTRIGRGIEALYSKETLAELGLSSASVQKAVKALVEKDIVVKKNGRFEVEDPFLTRFIIKEIR